MKYAIRAMLCLASLGALAGCSERTTGGDREPMPLPPDMGAAPESAGESGSDGEGGVTCREGLSACDGKCIVLSSDDEHCGACGHACKEPYWFGHCSEGTCPTAFWCGGVDQGLVTCDDVCASHHQECHDEPYSWEEGGCGGGGYHLYFDHDALQQCEIAVGSVHLVPDAMCTTPIDWSVDGGFEGGTAQAVACCCTQDLPP